LKRVAVFIVLILFFVIFVQSFGFTQNQVQIERLAGEDRYETAVRISQKGWQNADTVIITRGDDFPDALTGTPLSYKHNSPILLTYPDRLHPLTELELQRLGTKKAIILGGEQAVSLSVENTLKLIGLSVERYGGADRYETAVEIANALGPVNKAVVATGETFQDALVAGPYAAREGIPVLLTQKDSLPQATQDYLLEAEINETIVIGNTAAVSAAVADNLPGVQRVAGSTVNATAVAVSQLLMPGSTNFFFSRDDVFPDVLAGAALAAKLNVPILITPTNNLDSTVKVYLQGEKSISLITLLGGRMALSLSVENELRNIFSLPQKLTPQQLARELSDNYSFRKIGKHLVWFPSVSVYESDDVISIPIRLDDKSIDQWILALDDNHWEEIETWLLSMVQRVSQVYPDREIAVSVYFYDFYEHVPNWVPSNSLVDHKGDNWWSVRFTLLGYSVSKDFEWLPNK
jgi:putative cell wall-binding protein